jgi:glycosyltransferase involved in cell wall biosynthesis
VDVVDIGNCFPFPSPSERASAIKILRETPAGSPLVIGGLAFGALPEAGALQARTPLIALVHQPLALASALSPPQVEDLHNSERAALAAATGVVVTSGATAQILVDDYSVPPDHVSVVLPGNDQVPRARGSCDGTVRLVSVGSVVPGKGYDVLIAALAKIADMPWRLAIAGDLTRDVAAVAKLHSDIRAYNLGERIAVLGPLAPDALMKLYLASDIFVLASRFESYGMALAEAIAHGLPMVSTTAGAIPDTVPADAGLLVPPDDAAAFAEAVGRLICNSAERRRFATNASSAAAQLPSWEDSARRFASALDRIAGRAAET